MLLCNVGSSPSSPACAPAPLQRKLHTSIASEFELQMLLSNKETYKQRKATTLNTSHAPVPGLKRFSSCVNLMPHFINPSLFLSLLSVQRKHCLPSMALPFFSPLIHFMHLAPATLSPSNCGDPSATPQIDILGVPSDLTSIQLCLRDEQSPGSPYFSTILTPPLQSLFQSLFCLLQFLPPWLSFDFHLHDGCFSIPSIHFDGIFRSKVSLLRAAYGWVSLFLIHAVTCVFCSSI